jgi:triphosphatase
MPKAAQPSGLAEEVELKFTIPTAVADRVRQRLPLPAAGRGAQGHKRLTSVYYDTPELDLRQRGISLRVRHVDGRRLQTVKCDTPGAAPIGRLECENEISGDRPDLTCIGETGLRALFDEIDAPARLRPLFATEIDRTIWQLRQDGAAIECALDIGEIRAGGKSTAVHELELELKSGDSDGLFEAADILNRRLALCMEWESKSQRGYALVGGIAPAPPRPVALSRKMATGEAVAAIIAHCIAEIGFFWPLVRRAGDIEDVHQMRVAVRRLRAALSTFRRAIGGGRLDFEEDLRWLQDKLGTARDLDVLRADAIGPLLHGETAEEVAALDATSATARSEAYQDLRAALDSARCTGLWLAVAKWQRALARRPEADGKRDWSVAKYARAELRRRDRKIRKRGRRIAALDEGALHKLRIDAKKLRYAAEFFHDLYPKKRLRKTLKGLKGLQNLLGEINDARSAQRVLDGIYRRRAASNATAIAVAHGAGLVEGAARARVTADRSHLKRQWRLYDKTKRPWS